MHGNASADRGVSLDSMTDGFLGLEQKGTASSQNNKLE